jgi:hypothetical protein
MLLVRGSRNRHPENNRDIIGLERHVRFGSLADNGERISDVRFTPKSGHAQRQHRCPLSAISGHIGKLFLVEADTTNLVTNLCVEGGLFERLVCARARPPVGGLFYLSLGGILPPRRPPAANSSRACSEVMKTRGTTL